MPPYLVASFMGQKSFKRFKQFKWYRKGGGWHLYVILEGGEVESGGSVQGHPQQFKELFNVLMFYSF